MVKLLFTFKKQDPKNFPNLSEFSKNEGKTRQKKQCLEGLRGLKNKERRKLRNKKHY